MNETIKDKAATKKMNGANARALNAIKQRIKRNNRDYDKDIDAFRKNPEEFLKEPEEEKPTKPSGPKKSEPIANIAPENDDDDGFTSVGRGGKSLQFTPESIFKHLKVIIESRGKKNTDRAEQIAIMEKLLQVAQTPYQTVKVLLALISTRFDLTTGALNYMNVDQWKSYVFT